MLDSYGGELTWVLREPEVPDVPEIPEDPEVPDADGGDTNGDGNVDDTVAEGIWGENLTWKLDSEGTLTISGTGEMNYNHRGWESYKDSIKAIVVEEGVVGEVGYFENYTSLTSVSLPGTVTGIVQNGFSACTALETVVLSEGLTSIGSNAFYGCTGLTEIMIPASVRQLGARPFTYCANLTGIWVDENNQTYVNDENGVLFTRDMTTLVEAPCMLKGDYIVPETVVTINWGAFSGCKELTSVVIADGVSVIEPVLFADCTALLSVVIPDSVEMISNAAFENCSSLKEITIPSSVMCIDPGIFNGCSVLDKIVFKGDAPYNGDYYTFDGLMTTAYYPEGNTTWTEAVMHSYGGDITWIPYGDSAVVGDFSGDGLVNDADVAYLLWHTLFAEEYPISGDADFTGDGVVNSEDVAYLLWHTLFPDAYPL